MSFGSAIARLCTPSNLDEASFKDETVEEGGDAVARQRQLEGIAHILVGNGVLRGKELREARVDLVVIDVKNLAVRHLIDLEVANLVQ